MKKDDIPFAEPEYLQFLSNILLQKKRKFADPKNAFISTQTK
jgi:hypothetical protein